MAEVGAPGTGIKTGGGGKGPKGTVFLLRQSGVVGVGPASFGGEQLGNYGMPGQNTNSQAFAFDGIKGSYNSNINQQFTNSITFDPPGGAVIVPYVLYGMSGVVPFPITTFISLTHFLDDKHGQGGTSVPVTHRRHTAAGIGGFNWYIGSPPANINPQAAGPHHFGEIMGNVPHDPFAITGNQSTSGNTGKNNNGVIAALGVDDDFVINSSDNWVKGG